MRVKESVMDLVEGMIGALLFTLGVGLLAALVTADAEFAHAPGVSFLYLLCGCGAAAGFAAVCHSVGGALGDNPTSAEDRRRDAERRARQRWS